MRTSELPLVAEKRGGTLRNLATGPVVWLILLLLVSSWARADRIGTGTGYVDRLEYFPADRSLLVAGWAAPEQPTVFTSNLVVKVSGREVYRGRLQRSERPDVVAATGRPDWLWSGWQVQFALPRDIETGERPVAVRVRLSNGVEFDLESAPPARSIKIPFQRRPSVLTLAVASAAVLLPLLCFAFADPMANAVRRRIWRNASAASVFAVSVALSFLLLVATGVTGSSLRLALDASPFVEHDSIHWFGELRAVRGDEWALITPLAIGQVTHEPPLPIINRNLGPDGQNMLVVGMTGVPVKHVSTLVKPATWGYFVFDLRRALAWHWWLPFFACFAALWVFLRRILGTEWRVAAALSLTVAVAPYSVAFSGWPAYAVLFPVIGIVAADGLLRAHRLAAATFYGVLLGLSIAGFGLLLYPAWQISLAYLLVPLALAAFLREHHRLQLGSPQLVASVTALLTSAFLLAAWWLNARDAVSAIASTVYPGQRTTEVGGDIDPWFLIKGLMSPVTMYGSSTIMDQSDAGSFVFLLLPAVVGVLAHTVAARKLDPCAVVLLGYVTWVLVFVFTGFGISLARYTLWGSSPPYRQDLGLGLAQVLLFAWLAARAQESNLTGARWLWPLALAVAAVTALGAGVMFRYLPTAIATLLSPAFVALSCAALGAAAYLLVTRRIGLFLGVYCAWMLGTSIPFNPLAQAPTAITVDAALFQSRSSETPTALPPRIAVVGPPAWVMTLLAAGMSVTNAVHHYPQESLWKSLDPSGSQHVVYNRYHRLLFALATLPEGTSHRIDSPRLDEVRVTLDPRRFDFQTLGADAVLAAPEEAAALSENAGLQQVARHSEWTLYRIVR